MTLIFGISLSEINLIFLQHFAIFSITSDGEDLPLYKKSFWNNFLTVKFYYTLLVSYIYMIILPCEGANFFLFPHCLIFLLYRELTLRNCVFKH